MMRSFQRWGMSMLAALLIAACAHASSSVPRPALWVIEDSDSRLYLFGTIHTLRPEDTWRDERIERAFAESQELIVEVAEADDEAIMGQLFRQFGVDRQVDLSTKLDPECRADLEAAVAAYGANPQGTERLMPWLAALSFAQLAFAHSGYDVQLGVDLTLKREAEAAGMGIASLETAEGQMRQLAELSEAHQVAYLCDTLESAPTLGAQLDRVRDAWLVGDTGAIAQELEQGLSQTHPELYQAFFVARNQAMAQAILDRFQGAGASFVAIGAGHLVGDEGVLAQIESRGASVRRVH